MPLKVGDFSEVIDFPSEKKRQEYESQRSELLSEIENFQIPTKVGQFSEAIDFPSEKNRKDYESQRSAKYVKARVGVFT